MKKIALFLLIIVLLIAGWGSAQSLSDDPRVTSSLKLIEIWIEAQIDYEDIPGMSIGIVYDQNLLWSRGFGFADLEKKIPAFPGTIYSICSISKLLTSLSIMQLRDEGKLSLDEPLRKYLTWFNIKDKYPDAPQITLRGILSHSSGLPRESDYPYWTGPDFVFPTKEEIIKKLSGQEELYPAETYFQYSNLGMALAGEVVAAVSGLPFGEYIRQNVLSPLGLKDTSPEIPEAQRGKNLATGYSNRLRDGSRKVIPFFLVRGMAPAAGFASTVEDLARFASWQFRLLAKGGKEVINANTLKEMQRVHWIDPDWKTTWGLGFSISRRDGKTYIGHGGSCPGYRTQLSLCPKEKLAVIVMGNANDLNPEEYVWEIFKIIGPALAKAIESPSEAKEAEADLKKFVGRYERPIGREMQVLIMDGELAIISLPTKNPSDALTKLRRVKGNVFRRMRDDGELAEEIVFEVGPDGKVTRFVWNSQYAFRV